MWDPSYNSVARTVWMVLAKRKDRGDGPVRGSSRGPRGLADRFCPRLPFLSAYPARAPGGGSAGRGRGKPAATGGITPFPALPSAPLSATLPTPNLEPGRGGGVRVLPLCSPGRSGTDARGGERPAAQILTVGRRRGAAW